MDLVNNFNVKHHFFISLPGIDNLQVMEAPNLLMGRDVGYNKRIWNNVMSQQWRRVFRNSTFAKNHTLFYFCCHLLNIYPITTKFHFHGRHMLGYDWVRFEVKARISLGIIAFLMGPVFFGPPCTSLNQCPQIRPLSEN